jgi:hypothetical protein
MDWEVFSLKLVSQTTLLEEAIAADIHWITAQGYASILRIMGNFMVSL